MYDPSRAAYITYDDLRCLVSKGVDFVVQDNNGTDVTHPTLLQLALDPQTRSFPLLTPCFLKDLIRLYETSANDAIALYLDHCMALFAANRSRLDHTYGATSASAPGGVIHPPRCRCGDRGRRTTGRRATPRWWRSPFGAAP